MISAYDVLGVGARSDRGEIRAAYVNLAKQLHPDRNAGSLLAEQRLREVNQAYELLKDAERRSAYDQLLQQSRGRTIRHRRRAVAVMAASFILTAAGVGALLLVARLSLFDDAVQASGSSEPARTSQDQSVALSTASVGSITPATRELPQQAKEPTQDEASPRSPIDAAEADALVRQQVAALQTQNLLDSEPTDGAPQHDWITYHNDRFGFAIDYPADVFAADDRTLGDFWRLFVSRDGRARLLVTAGFNIRRLTTAAYRQSVMDEAYQGASMAYAPLRKTWFVLAGSKDEEGFYERATFACDGRIIHRWRLTYPAGERAYYSNIIERIHLGYKHVRGVGPHCPSNTQ
jgi:curved DNA-binding protein CbpA